MAERIASSGGLEEFEQLENFEKFEQFESSEPGLLSTGCRPSS